MVDLFEKATDFADFTDFCSEKQHRFATLRENIWRILYLDFIFGGVWGGNGRFHPHSPTNTHYDTIAT